MLDSNLRYAKEKQIENENERISLEKENANLKLMT